MNIVAAFKVVPDDQDIQVSADGTLDYSKAKNTVSAYDLNAIEAAAQLAAANEGSNVVAVTAVSYTHLRAHETGRNLVCRLLLEKKKKKQRKSDTTRTKCLSQKQRTPVKQ